MRSAEELAAAWSVLLADIDHAIEAQRGRSAGGQQVTGPRLSYAPLSVLHEVQRQCRWALEGRTDYLEAYRAEARREALEEAAKVAESADTLFDGRYNRGVRVRAEQAAAAIRALAAKERP